MRTGHIWGHLIHVENYLKLIGREQEFREIFRLRFRAAGGEIFVVILPQIFHQLLARQAAQSFQIDAIAAE